MASVDAAVTATKVRDERFKDDNDLLGCTDCRLLLVVGSFHTIHTTSSTAQPTKTLINLNTMKRNRQRLSKKEAGWRAGNNARLSKAS
jgi:hypothetical protein